MGRPKTELTRPQQRALDKLRADHEAKVRATKQEDAQISCCAELGCPWREIGEALGVAAQSAHEAYKRKGDQP